MFFFFRLYWLRKLIHFETCNFTKIYYKRNRHNIKMMSNNESNGEVKFVIVPKMLL